MLLVEEKVQFLLEKEENPTKKCIWAVATRREKNVCPGRGTQDVYLRIFLNVHSGVISGAEL